jgi:glucose-6-phosphate 1-epimerase
MSIWHPLVQAELPPSVRVGPGAGGLPRVTVAARPGRGGAEVYLHGATVTAWAPDGEQPVLWLSRASEFSAGAAIRGGVPICFPWFGAHAGDPAAPRHGFARQADWALVEAADTADGTRLAFRLADSAGTRGSAWPHRFEATYRVTVGQALVLALEVANLDEGAVTFEQALHSYFAVRDVREVTVTGLEEASYVDQLAGPEPLPPSGEPLRLAAETDRIYLDPSSPVTIQDPGARRAIAISGTGARATVVWNPWADKARALRDLADDEWPRMLCVETCNVRAARVRLGPGDRHTMTATVQVPRG